jgi:hypothetical protein
VQGKTSARQIFGISSSGQKKSGRTFGPIIKRSGSQKTLLLQPLEAALYLTNTRVHGPTLTQGFFVYLNIEIQGTNGSWKHMGAYKKPFGINL